MSREELDKLIAGAFKAPVLYSPSGKTLVAQPPPHNHIKGADEEAAPMINIKSIESETEVIPFPQLPAKAVADTYPIPISKATHESAIVWRFCCLMVGFAIYGCAIANNVYSAWGLPWLPFGVMVAPSVVGETALVVALPAAMRWSVWGIALAALCFGVVALNEFRVIAMTTADQAAQRASVAVSAVASACPPSSTTTTKQGKKTTTTTTAESAACALAKTSIAAARPEVAAFQHFVEWASRGWWSPTLEDFDNWRTLLLVLFLNSGGLFVGLARR